MKKHSVGTAFDSGIGSDLIFGTVTSASPLKITVDDSLVIGSSRLIIPSYLSGESFSFDIEGTRYTGTTPNKLLPGAHVCMIRASGGQKYAVLGIID